MQMRDPKVEKIRLLILTPTLECGGSEKFVSLVCNNIDTVKFSVTLGILNNANPFYTIQKKEIAVVDLKMEHVRNSLFKIRGIVKQSKPDIILSTSNHLNIYLAIFRIVFPKRPILIARETSMVSLNKTRVKFSWLYNHLIKKYYKRFDFIVCQNTCMQQDLVHHYNIPINKTAVIHNAVVQNLSVISKNNAAGKIYKFITVARLSEEKGIERLIHTVGLLMLPFKFYIMGKGDQREKLQKLVNELELKDKVFLQGEKERPFDGMEDADLFLMGSYYEGFPNVLLEAGSYGIPVVAFNVPGGIGEIITEGENGLLVEDNDLLGFAAAINKAIASDFDRNKIIETTQKRFSVEAMMKKLEDLMLQL